MNFNQTTLLAVTAISVTCLGIYAYISKSEPVNTYSSYKPVEQPRPVEQPKPTVPVVLPDNGANVGGSRRNRRKKSHKKTKKR